MKNVLITLPAYNEERNLEKAIYTLISYARENLKMYNYQILIADNASGDKTSEIGKKLEKKFKEVKYYFSPEKGRGKVIYKVWNTFNFDIYAYMDVDLSVDVSHTKDLLEAVDRGGYDISIGTRNNKKSYVKRSFKRTFISKAYIILLKMLLGINSSDTQCGFKAITKNAKNVIWEKINPLNWEGCAWFFDTELILIAEKVGMKIFELPVKWLESPYTTTSLIRDAKEDLKGIYRVLRTKPWEK